MDGTSNVIAIVILLVANGFLVAAEFALAKARGFRIETLAAKGSAAALGITPALSGGVILTTVTDIIGSLCFLRLASLFLL